MIHIQRHMLITFASMVFALIGFALVLYLALASVAGTTARYYISEDDPNGQATAVFDNPDMYRYYFS